MEKTLTGETKFGRGKAVVTVMMFTDGVYLDGQETSEKVIKTTKVEIVVNGKIVEKDYGVSVLEYNNLTDTLFEKAGLDPNKKYTRVGNKAITEGDEAEIAIQNIIEELEKELASEFEVKTVKEVKQEKEIEEAQAVVAQAEKQGIEQLMTSQQIKKWRTNYNTVNNEGGEGYIPYKVSKESYKKALEVLK